MALEALFSRQPIMRRVLISLIPILLFAIYSFGLRILPLLAVVTVAGVSTEYLILRFMHGEKEFKIPEAIFVSCFLFVLTLPPTVPFWVAAVGISFGILFGKAVFGGFAKNIFNPALVGRCLIFISFPKFMTMAWAAPFRNFPGGFLHYSSGADVVSGVTPLVETGLDPLRLFLGQISGSSGEISTVLILMGAVYLVLTKTASLRIMISALIGFLSANIILYFTGAVTATPLISLLSGGFLFAAVFMATDPITAPRDQQAQIIFGLLIVKQVSLTLILLCLSFSSIT